LRTKFSQHAGKLKNPKREKEDPKKPQKERGTQKEKKRSGMEEGKKKH
jgi:hypothetical protein